MGRSAAQAVRVAAVAGVALAGTEWAITDGRTRKVWVTARSVDEALKDLGLDSGRMRLSASRSARVPLSGFAMRVNTEKTVTLVVDKRRESITTYAATVNDLLAERERGIGLPSEATPREQTYRAIKLYQAAGRDQWPHCGVHL